MDVKGGGMSDNTRWQEFNSIIDNEGLHPKEKLLLLTIFRYYNPQKGYSYPPKEILKAKCSITQDRDYYKYIKNLEINNYIVKETIKGKGCRFYINNCHNDSHCQNDSYLQNEGITHLQNDSQVTCKMTVQKENKTKVKENNVYSHIIDYLNAKAGSNYKSNIKITETLIDARLKEGFTIDDFYKVIDVKTKEWINNKDYKKYLRPQTLFDTKFESYLNENQSVNEVSLTKESLKPKLVYIN